MRFAEGISIRPVVVQDWHAWALCDTAPNGHVRPVAFLDEEGLRRIAEQSARALWGEQGPHSGKNEKGS